MHKKLFIASLCLFLNIPLQAYVHENPKDVLEKHILSADGILDVQFKEDDNDLKIISHWINEDAVYNFFRSSAHKQLVGYFGMLNVLDSKKSEINYERDPRIDFNSEVLVINSFNKKTGEFFIKLQSTKEELQNDSVSSSQFLNILGSSMMGHLLGLSASVFLLAKDGTLGIVITGGPEFWGSSRAFALALMTYGTTVLGGFLGYYYQVNLLDSFKS